ncbi:MAG: T9SS type B sorting domain-containing protein [Winogradskyella sp.]|nr:T9SS type B sorting domain-containing protein [Winogradskyella sp.]
MFSIEMYAQLGFCQGNSGDPIFTEDFGVGTVNSALPPGTTTYTFNNGLPDDGFYTVIDGTVGNGFDWHQIQDHTPGDVNGKCLIIQAGPSAGEFYRTTVSGLCENTTYEFSSWVINLVRANSFCSTQPGGTIPINVRFEIWDDSDTNLLASGDTGNIVETNVPNWRDFALVFQTLPAQTSVILKMINNGAGGCGNDLAIDDIVFKTCGDLITAEDTSGNSSTTICSSQTPYSDTITAIPDFAVFSSHFYQWQVSTDGTNWTDVVGATNASLPVTGITATTFYRSKVAEFATNLSNSDCITFSDVYQILVNQNPAVPTSNGDVNFNCSTNQATLSVIPVSGVTINWYDLATGGILLQSNSETFTVTAPGTYYAEAVDTITGCVSSVRVAITASSSTFPDAPLSNGDVDFNCTTNQAILSVTGVSGIVVNWYDLPVGGILIQASSLTYNATAPGIYYAEAVNSTTGCVSLTRTPITASISLPSTPISDGDVILDCTTNQATLSVNVPSGINVDWYDDLNAGSLLASNSTTLVVNTAGIYYAEARDPITGCVSGTRVAVNVSVSSQDDPSFDITATCDGASVNIIGTPGGVFVFNPVPSDGATIDTATGNVSNGTSGVSYTIQYTTLGVCSATSSETFVVLTEDDASFTITPTCDGGLTNITGDLGGIFSFNPLPTDGAAVDPNTGEVTGASPGISYTIEYITSGTCPDTNTEIFTVFPLEDPSFALTATCDGAIATIIGDTGGVFRFDPVPSDTAIIDAVSGTISNGIPGSTYTVVYLTQGSCPQSATQDVTILSEEDASFTVLPTCDGGVSTIMGTIGGTFAFEIPPTDSAVINVITGEITGGTFNTSYSIRYTTPGICSDTEIVTFNSSFGDDASFSITPTCDGGLVTLTGTTGGLFSFNPVPIDGAVIDPITGNVTNVSQGTTYTIEYTTIGICPATSFQSFTFDLAITIFAPTPLELCDDLGESPGNEVTVFDLTEKDLEITGGDSRLSVSYYETNTDAQTQMNAIPDPTQYTNTSVGGLPQNPQTLYVVVTNSDSGCIEFTTLTIRVLPNPTPTPSNLIPDMELCDVINTGDGLEIFNLRGLENDNAQEDLILNGELQVTLTYHESFDNADSGTDAIPDPSNYENTQSPNQIIYVRMTSDITGCYEIVNFTISVKPLPSVIAVTDFIQCELNTNGISSFDLTTKTDEVLNGQNPLRFMVTYHGSLADAASQTGALVSPYTNLTNPQQIFVRITDSETGCFINTQRFNLQVDEGAEANPNMIPIVYEVCYDGLENDDNPANDSAQFDLSTQNDQVLDGQDQASYTVSYFETESDAILNVNQLPNLYENTINPQVIYARVDNNTLRVQAIALNISALTSGLDLDANGTIDTYDTNANGIFDLIDVDGDGLSDGIDSNGDGIYEFVDTDGDGIGDPVDLNNDGIFDNQVDGSICFDVTELTLQVNPLPKFDLDELYVLCRNTNGTEILDAPILDTELSGLDYSFEWSYNGALIPTETGPRLEATQGGTYSVVVTDISTSNVTSCINMDTTEVIESEPPILTAEVTTQLFGDRNVIEAIATGIGDYEYSLDGGPWRDNGVFTNVSAGLRVITARDKIGCGFTTVEVFVVDYPLYFTPNGDGNNDTWNIEGIGSDAKIYIFDRYGKLLKQLSPTGQGWNGTYNGNLMPTSDYWFTLEYIEPSTNGPKEFRAHFTLKR